MSGLGWCQTDGTDVTSIEMFEVHFQHRTRALVAGHASSVMPGALSR